MNSSSGCLNALDFGTIDFSVSNDLQKMLASYRSCQKITDTLVFAEHPAVITIGHFADRSNILWSEEKLKRKKIDVVDIDRGGDVTLHLPGQLVIYPIFDLMEFHISLRKFINVLEEIVIEVCRKNGVLDAERSSHPGVYVGGKQISAIGLHISRDVITQGISVNVSPDIELFKSINLCGVKDLSATSIFAETGRIPDINDVKTSFLNLFYEYFFC